MSLRHTIRRAATHIRDKKWRQALTECEKGMKIAPENYTLLVCYGKALKETNSMKKSREAYLKAILVDEKVPTAYHALLELYLEEDSPKLGPKICELCAKLFKFKEIEGERLVKYIRAIVENSSKSEDYILKEAVQTLLSRFLYDEAFIISLQIARHSDDALDSILSIDFLPRVAVLEEYRTEFYVPALERVRNMEITAYTPDEVADLVIFANRLLLCTPVSMDGVENEYLVGIIDRNYAKVVSRISKVAQRRLLRDIGEYCVSRCFVRQFAASYMMWLVSRFSEVFGVDFFRPQSPITAGVKDTDLTKENFFVSQVLSKPSVEVYHKQVIYAIALTDVHKSDNSEEKMEHGILTNILVAKAYISCGAFKNALAHLETVISALEGGAQATLLDEALFYKAAILTWTGLKEEKVDIPMRICMQLIHSDDCDSLIFSGALETYARHLIYSKKYEEACDLYEDCTASISQTTTFYFGWALHRTGESRRALELMSKSIDEKVLDSVSMYWLAEVQLANGEYLECISTIKSIIKEDEARSNDPTSIAGDLEFPYLFHVLAEAKMGLGDEEGALLMYRQAIEIDPRCSESGKLFCELLERRNEYDLIEDICASAVERYKRNNASGISEELDALDLKFNAPYATSVDWAMRIVSYFNIVKEKDYKETIQMLNSIISGSKGKEFEEKGLVELLAYAYYKNGMMSSALSNFRKVVALSLEDATITRPLYFIGVISLAMQEYDDAFESFARCIECDGSFVPAACGIAETYVAVGDEAYGNGMRTYASECYERALQTLKPFDMGGCKVLILLITTYIKLGSIFGRLEYCFDVKSRDSARNYFAMAESYINTLMENDETMAGRLFYFRGLIEFHRYQRGELDRLGGARSNFGLALERIAGDSDGNLELKAFCYCSLAATYFHLPSEALKLLSLSIATSPFSADVTYSVLGYLLINCKAYSVARRALSISHSINPYLQACWLGLSAINRLSERNDLSKLHVSVAWRLPIENFIRISPAELFSVQEYRELTHCLSLPGSGEDILLAHALACLKQGKAVEAFRSLEKLFNRTNFSPQFDSLSLSHSNIRYIAPLVVYSLFLTRFRMFFRAGTLLKFVHQYLAELEPAGKVAGNISKLLQIVISLEARLAFRVGNVTMCRNHLEKVSGNVALLAVSSIIENGSHTEFGVQKLLKELRKVPIVKKKKRYFSILMSLVDSLEYIGRWETASRILEEESKRGEMKSIFATWETKSGHSMWFHMAASLFRMDRPIIIDNLEYHERVLFQRDILLGEGRKGVLFFGDGGLEVCGNLLNALTVLGPHNKDDGGSVPDSLRLMLWHNVNSNKYGQKDGKSGVDIHKYDIESMIAEFEKIISNLSDTPTGGALYTSTLARTISQLIMLCDRSPSAVKRGFGDRIVGIVSRLVNMELGDTDLQLILAEALLLRAKATAEDVEMKQSSMEDAETALRIFTCLAKSSNDNQEIHDRIYLRTCECLVKVGQMAEAKRMLHVLAQETVKGNGEVSISKIAHLISLVAGTSLLKEGQGDLIREFVNDISQYALSERLDLLDSFPVITFVSNKLSVMGFPDLAIELLTHTLLHLEGTSGAAPEVFLTYLNMTLISVNAKRMRAAFKYLEDAKKSRSGHHGGDELFALATAIVYIKLKKVAQAQKLLKSVVNSEKASSFVDKDLLNELLSSFS